MIFELWWSPWYNVQYPTTVVPMVQQYPSWSLIHGKSDIADIRVVGAQQDGLQAQLALFLSLLALCLAVGRRNNLILNTGCTVIKLYSS